VLGTSIFNPSIKRLGFGDLSLIIHVESGGHLGTILVESRKEGLSMRELRKIIRVYITLYRPVQTGCLHKKAVYFIQQQLWVADFSSLTAYFFFCK